MQVRYMYKGKIVGHGCMTIMPRTGDFIEWQATDRILKVEAVMFKVVLSGDTGAIIYLKDIMGKTEEMLRKY